MCALNVIRFILVSKKYWILRVALINSVKNTDASKRKRTQAAWRGLSTPNCRILLTFFFVFVGLCFRTAQAENCSLDQATERVQVEHVIDGDTVRLVDGRRVRFSAVNAPELARNFHPAQPFADEAKALIETLIAPSNTVLLRHETQKKDRYSRVLAHIFNKNGLNLQSELLARGLAAHSVEPPNLWQNSCYQSIDHQARASRTGIWQTNRFGTVIADNIMQPLGGFYRITGKVQRIDTTDKNTLIKLTDRVYFRISQRDMKYFSALSANQLRGRQVTAQGWASHDKVNTYLRLRHPSALSLTQ